MTIVESIETTEKTENIMKGNGLLVLYLSKKYFTTQ